MARARTIAALPSGDPRLVAAPTSLAAIAEDDPLRRQPRAPLRGRPDEFYAAFESKALFYDCFWHADGQRVLLVGPPPLSLSWEFQSAKFTALPLDFWLGARLHISQSVMVTELYDVPPGTTEVVVHLGGATYVVPIRENLGPAFAGRNVLFTMSRDNELGWIAEWARYHVRWQGVDGIVLFDNGSTAYDTAAIADTLLGIDGLGAVAVVSLPWSYGRPDPAVLNNPYYSLFLQIGSMSMALRRFAPAARGLLNADIDELVASPPGRTVFDLLDRAARGLIVMRGQFVEARPSDEAPPAGRTHRHYPYRLADPRARQSRQKKWVLNPRRNWVADLDVHPYMHWIHGRPWFGKSQPAGVFYRHFRGISTNWKDNRTETGHLQPDHLELDPGLPALFAGQ